MLAAMTTPLATPPSRSRCARRALDLARWGGLAALLVGGASCAGRMGALPLDDQERFRFCSTALVAHRCPEQMGEEQPTYEADCLREQREAYVALPDGAARGQFLRAGGCPADVVARTSFPAPSPR